MTMSDETFNINIKRLALLVLPTWLRRPLVGALIYAGVTTLGRLAQDLRKYRITTRYRLRHNGQVCKLRGVLNDEFDPELRRITIEDSESSQLVEASTVYRRDIGKWIILPIREVGSTVVNRRGFDGITGFDFWINVPRVLINIQTRIRLNSITNTYKLASKRFTINETD